MSASCGVVRTETDSTQKMSLSRVAKSEITDVHPDVSLKPSCRLAFSCFVLTLLISKRASTPQAGLRVAQPIGAVGPPM